MAALAHRPGEEARIEQMQDRVLDAADVLVDRQPVVGDRGVGRRRLVGRIGEADEIPGRIDERVHRVGLAPRGLCRIAGRRRASRSDGGRADCRADRRSRPRAAAPAGPSPERARRRSRSQWMTGIGQPQ